jgi:hypothetical protein
MMDNKSYHSQRRLILIELNELNFDLVKEYTFQRRLPAFEKLLSGRQVRTYAENQYTKLEPWIQWVSVHTGLDADHHGVFRLGDIVGNPNPQFFEIIESAGFTVGCISPMNAENRLKNPAYFIPDPWTVTNTDATWWSKMLGQAISQVVNDNAQSRVSFKSALLLMLGLIRFSSPRHYHLYLKLAAKSRGAVWRKALILDLFLHDLHWNWFGRKSPDFSTLFLNAGAHIQHHYLFNSYPVKSRTELINPTWYLKEFQDPFGEMLEVYDAILSDYLLQQQAEVIVSTGLSQKPYDRVKYYYRLRDHENFLNSLGLKFNAVYPRMTRDFLIEFTNSESLQAAEKALADIVIEGTDQKLFGEIDNRGDSLFVTLTYPNEVDDSIRIVVGETSQFLKPLVAFVAIKNGMHQSEGFAFFTPGIDVAPLVDGQHVRELYNTVINFFDSRKSRHN